HHEGEAASSPASISFAFGPARVSCHAAHHQRHGRRQDHQPAHTLSPFHIAFAVFALRAVRDQVGESVEPQPSASNTGTQRRQRLTSQEPNRSSVTRNREQMRKSTSGGWKTPSRPRNASFRSAGGCPTRIARNPWHRVDDSYESHSFRNRTQM